MRVLLDENVPHDLIEHLVGHNVATVQGLGWSGIANGALLSRAIGVADAFVTMDRNLEQQHDLTSLPFGVVVLAARSSKIVDLLPLIGDLLTALANLKPGQVNRVGA